MLLRTEPTRQNEKHCLASKRICEKIDRLNVLCIGTRLRPHLKRLNCSARLACLHTDGTTKRC